MLRVSSSFQTLENINTTRPAALWFQMFSRVWKPDDTLALVFEIVQSNFLIYMETPGRGYNWSFSDGYVQLAFLNLCRILWPIRDPIFVRFWARPEWNGSHQEP